MSERNHEVTRAQRLLTKEGKLAEPGWARKEVWQYDRKDIKAPAFRIKEWDYYLIVGDDFAVALTISDDGYIGLQSASLLKLGAEPWEHTETILNAFPMGKLHMPPSSDTGDVKYADKRLQMDFINRAGERRLTCNFTNFCDGKPFSCDITLRQPQMDTMVIATPWVEKDTSFYFNRKINCMPASGRAMIDGKEYVFDPEKNFGTLDWGRGVWTYDNTWYWGSGNGIAENGKSFGFNLGYGFSDRSSATENIFFYEGKGHKLDDVKFEIPVVDGVKKYTDPWKFTSSDGRFEADFIPVLDRAAKIDVKFIVTDQHQVFGRMTGRAVLDDGTEVKFKDILCFAEDVHNKY